MVPNTRWSRREAMRSVERRPGGASARSASEAPAGPGDANILGSVQQMSTHGRSEANDGSMRTRSQRGDRLNIMI